MKTSLIRRFAIAMLLLVLSLFLAPVAGVAAFALPALALLNYGSAPLYAGTSFPVPNTTTTTNLVADNADAREQLWVMSVLDSTKASWQDAPLAEGGFMGRYTAGSKPQGNVLQKAIVEITDTEKVAGKTVHIQTRAGLGGPGVSGNSTRLGNEQKIHIGGYDVSIGRFWFGVGYDAIARNETFQGPTFDMGIRDDLRKLHAKKRNDDHLMRLRVASASGVGLNNLVFPDGISTVATLKTANVLDTNLITAMGEYLPSLGGVPIDTTDDSGGSVGELFMVFSSDRALSPLLTEPAYIQGLQQADARGDSNRLFKGGFKNWNGHGIYRWIHRDHANKGPIGSPLLPRARLGYALTGANTNSIIHGGGLACGATVDNVNTDNTNTGDTTDGFAPRYFEFFSNSPYTYYNGDTIAAVENVTKYLLIINNDGTGYACYSYRVNNAKAIIILGRISIGVGTEVNTHPQGSLIVECNIIGTTWARSLMLGAQALVCGNGRIDGSPSNPKMGNVTSEKLDHGMQLSVGVEAVWGNAAAKRAGDGAFPGFLLAQHAVPVPGAPTIS